MGKWSLAKTWLHCCYFYGCARREAAREGIFLGWRPNRRLLPHEAQQPEQHDGSYGGHDEAAEQSGGGDADHAEQKSAQDGADHPDNHVADEAVLTPAHDS